MSFFDDASLVFLPSGQAGKDGKAYSMKPTNGDGDFTFSRGSNLTATRVDSNGLIEKGRENLLLQSNSFDTTWTTSNATPTSGQSGYDGSSDAWLLEADSDGSGRRINQSITQGGVSIFSVYVKAGTTDFIRLNVSGAGNCYFDISESSPSVLTSSNVNLVGSIQAIGDGWNRCSLLNLTGSSITEVRINLASGDNDLSAVTGDNIYIQDAQIELGLVATEYIESGASTGLAGILEDSPRFDYSGGASCPSLLLEPSRTNIVPISEGIPEDTIQVTLTENYGTSPEGVQNSLKVQKNGVSASDRIFPIDNYNATLVSGTSYSVSAFVKNIDVDGITTIGCRLGSGGTLFRLGYQWSGSSLTKATEYSAGTRTNEILEDYGNRWWRIGFSFEADNTQGGIELDIDRDNGSATTSIETYGWQLEEGSYPTSYIPNHSGGSVTREAEVCEGAGDASTFNDSEGVLYLEASAIDNGSSEKAIAINDGTTNNRINIRIVNNTIKGLVILGGSLVCNISYTATSVITSNKIAFKYKRNDFALWLNGVEVGTDTSGSIFPADTLNELSFDYGGASAFFYGNVEQVLYFPTALSTADCEILTGATSYESFSAMATALNYTTYE